MPRTVRTPTGLLYFFDADPSITSGATAMTAAARVTILGRVPVESGDWDSDANGASAYIVDTPIPFHALSTLYVAFKLTGATGMNADSADDEQLEVNFWYKRES